VQVLDRDWSAALGQLVREAAEEFTVVSPFITQRGAQQIEKNVAAPLRKSGVVRVMTDLSPSSLCQGSIEPAAVRRLCAMSPSHDLIHLPRLHAKVYIADAHSAIITSGNLTAGGLVQNYECGVFLDDVHAVSDLRGYLLDLAEIGARVSQERLDGLCDISAELRMMFEKEQSAAVRERSKAFTSLLRSVEDELIRAKLGDAPVHTVFARTIVFLLLRHGPMTTVELEERIQDIHPDLCDDQVDRIIGTKSFGRKWKHAVRSSQQRLKRNGRIINEKIAGQNLHRWRLLTQRGAAPCQRWNKG